MPTAFDELKKFGLDAFTKKHDLYWDIPLNESLPQPLIELPMPTIDDRRPTTDAQAATQNVIDFGEAVAAREMRKPAKKAAERRAKYEVREPKAESGMLFGDEDGALDGDILSEDRDDAY